MIAPVMAFRAIDAMLRGEAAFAARRSVVFPIACVLVFGPIYGAIMGTYAVDALDRLLMVAFSGAKVPLLLMLTATVCLPGFFVLNTIAGLRDDFRDALRAIFIGQAGVAVCLASLAPLTLVGYLSNLRYPGAVLFNGGMFAIASIAGQILMWRNYKELLDRNPRHYAMLAAWLVLYVFVGIQMGWILRPFVGSPDLPVSFFRSEPFSNAYVHVAQLMFGGR